MKSIKKIYLTWRKGRGCSRIPVGVITKNSNDGVLFSYIESGVKQALKNGFKPYIDFPILEKTYTENVVENFGQRLVKSERSDVQKYYDFWEVDPLYKDDKFYMLAHTQGLLATDYFEFIAEYYPVKGLKFVSEICGFSERKIGANTLQVGDDLRWELEPNNEYDKFAVKLFKNGLLIGYVKTIHNRVFYENRAGNLLVKVKSIDQNGHINRVFISISI